MKCTIEKMSYDGNGITHINNKICFISHALTNEEVDISITKDEKKYSEAIVNKIIKPSTIRIPSYCPYAKECGGCSYDIVSYEDSIKLKKEAINDLLSHNGLPLLNDLIPSNPNLYYRNKISLKIENHQYGYYQESSHTFIPITSCSLASSSINSLLKDFNDLNINNGSIVIRSNENDELLLEIETEDKPRIEKELVNKHKIAGIIWNHRCVYNNPYFIIDRNHILYKIYYDSFFQVNPYISEEISKQLLTNFNKKDKVFDLYCGVGFFSLKLAKIVSEVIGIEENPSAILNANYNASLNNIINISFHIGKVENIIDKIPTKVNKVVVDPPRSGLHEKVINTLLKNKYQTIIYISCNPMTLVRDLKKLLTIYNIESITGYDMFSYTKHVETVSILRIKE